MTFQPRRTHALRTYLLLGLGGLGLGFLLITQGLRHFIQPQLSEMVGAQARSLVRHRAQQELLVLLLEEEGALRSFLGAGDPSFLEAAGRAGRVEDEQLRALQENLPRNGGTLGREQLARLQFLITRWHEQTMLPLVQARFKGPLPDPRAAMAAESRAFDAIKAASQELTHTLDAQDEQRFQALDESLDLARNSANAAEVALFVLALLFVRWLLLRVSTPLAELAEQARAGDGYPEPGAGQSVKEVAILGRTLYELDQQSRERERRLRREHEETLAARAFEEVVQHLSREEDLLQALDQALARHLQTTRQRILLHPPGSAALVAALPPLEAEEAARHPILADPNRCRALHQGAAVALDAAAPTACLCDLGVPSGGSYLCLPMVASGRVLGLVNLQARAADHWDADRRRVAGALVATSAAALQSIRALELAQERAIRDGLTGVFNRRFLDEILPKTLDQAARNDLPFSLLMLDIDHFKAFNDEFGHEGGDQVLRLFAQCLQAHVRGGDVVARYGGEEFAILLPHAGADFALGLAERLRATVGAMALPEPDFPRERRITMSVGLASFPAHTRSQEALVSLADRALYEAKRTGRNRTVSAGSLALPAAAQA